MNDTSQYKRPITLGNGGVGHEEVAFLRVHELKYGKMQYTDTANAGRLIDLCGNDIRYNSRWKKWLVWNGKCWEMDEGHLMDEKGMEVIHSIYDDILAITDPRDQLEIEKEGLKAESLRRRNAVIELASRRKEVHITTEDVDRELFLLNVGNGTVNLKTGELQEHSKDDLITKIANVDFDASAKCPAWKKFVSEIMGGKADLTIFLQAAAGWAVTGDTSEQCMFMLYGSGANGKSTFLNVIMKILGDYAVSASTETFMKKQGDTMSNDIARLRGTRFVTTTEAEQGRRLSEPLIKQITGNDVMTARFLYGEFFTFTPSFKIFIFLRCVSNSLANHKSPIKSSRNCQFPQSIKHCILKILIFLLIMK
jgi:putative DNA primase/helicase